MSCEAHDLDSKKLYLNALDLKSSWQMVHAANSHWRSGHHSLYFFEHFTPGVNFGDIIDLTFDSVEEKLKV